MRRGPNSIILYLSIVLALASLKEAHAYGKTWLGRDLERRISEAGFSLGPFRMDTAFTLSNVGYDSNIYYMATENPVHDVTLTAGLALNIYLPIKKKIIISVYELPEYVYYMETVRERGWNNFFNGEVHFVFSRLVLTLGKGYTSARERWNTEIDIRPRQIEDSYLGSLLWQVSKRTSFGLSYRRAKFNYESAEFQGFDIPAQLDRVEDYVSFTSFYQASFRTRLFIDAEYGRFDFANPLSLKDSESYAAHGGFEFSPLGKIRGTVKVGYKYLNTLSASRQDYRGLVGDSQVSVRLMSPWRIRAYYRRDIRFSVWYDAAYFLEDVYGAGTSLYLFRNIRLDYDYSRGRNSYPEGISVKRLDDYLIHSVGLYLRIKSKVALGVIASHWERRSNLTFENDNRNFLGFNLIYDF
jgi:hypothetical protein